MDQFAAMMAQQMLADSALDARRERQAETRRENEDRKAEARREDEDRKTEARREEREEDRKRRDNEREQDRAENKEMLKMAMAMVATGVAAFTKTKESDGA